MILVISDYHKNEEAVLALIKKYNPDHILCCGDGESEDKFYLENNIISVKGNCDFANLELVKVVEIDKMGRINLSRKDALPKPEKAE